MPCLIDLQRMVFSHLEYQAFIHLSTMNRYFYHKINPTKLADPLGKAQFVMRAARDFLQHRPSQKGRYYRPGNFECYICFRVRSLIILIYCNLRPRLSTGTAVLLGDESLICASTGRSCCGDSALTAELVKGFTSHSTASRQRPEKTFGYAIVGKCG